MNLTMNIVYIVYVLIFEILVIFLLIFKFIIGYKWSIKLILIIQLIF